ncbi:type I-E CRISPR-associated endoribonuclease Cas2 [SAR202 cluster bacterium AD-804-J14_MRT_500m]|nr:type I-E CRISPR-associated endoribonuclease Cas2 [SAR202 cluster bacterium AD-804-J14_MRT_500m]
MVVLILEKAEPTVRGEITRWLLEPKAGVFTGTISALVRDKLWKLSCDPVKCVSATLIYSSPNEQGLEIRTWGLSKKEVVNFDGISLLRISR